MRLPKYFVLSKWKNCYKLRRYFYLQLQESTLDLPHSCFIYGQYNEHLIPILLRRYGSLIYMFNELYKNTYNNVHQEILNLYIQMQPLRVLPNGSV